MYKNFTKSKEWSVAKDIMSICVFLSVFVYLTIGFFVKIWHPSWLIFVLFGGIAISSVIYLAWKYGKNDKFLDNALSFDKQFEKSKNYNKSVKFSGVIFMITVIVYILLASFSGLWHPLWLIFFLMTIIDEIKALVVKLRYVDYKKDLQEVEEDK